MGRTGTSRSCPSRASPRQVSFRFLTHSAYTDHESTSTKPQPSKWRVLRVARLALRALTIPATWTSRTSTVRPARCRSPIKRGTYSGRAQKRWMAAGVWRVKTVCTRNFPVRLPPIAAWTSRTDCGRSTEPVTSSVGQKKAARSMAEGSFNSFCSDTCRSSVRIPTIACRRLPWISRLTHIPASFLHQ